jgi:CheY-like chemotaxis protein
MLIVEDHQETRRVLRGIFSRLGWEVAEARTVAEGLAALSRWPHVLILDLRLPDGDGKAILEKLREEGQATHVVVCTGVQDPGRLRDVQELNPDIVLEKPIDAMAIYWACESAAAKGRIPAPVAPRVLPTPAPGVGR